MIQQKSYSPYKNKGYTPWRQGKLSLEELQNYSYGYAASCTALGLISVLFHLKIAKKD